MLLNYFYLQLPETWCLPSIHSPKVKSISPGRDGLSFLYSSHLLNGLFFSHLDLILGLLYLKSSNGFQLPWSPDLIFKHSTEAILSCRPTFPPCLLISWVTHYLSLCCSAPDPHLPVHTTSTQWPIGGQLSLCMSLWRTGEEPLLRVTLHTTLWHEHHQACFNHTVFLLNSELCQDRTVTTDHAGQCKACITAYSTHGF